jgi:hypothetical protein
MKSLVGYNVKVETSRQNYSGVVVGHLFQSSKVDVKITEVIKGNKKVGKVARFSMDQITTVSA